MITDDKNKLLAEIRTLNPIAQEAIKFLAGEILDDITLMSDADRVTDKALFCCAAAFNKSVGNPTLPQFQDQFDMFLKNNFQRVGDLAFAVVVCIGKQQQRKKVWGGIGKVAAAVGLFGLGAFFG